MQTQTLSPSMVGLSIRTTSLSWFPFFNITANQGICFVELLWKVKGYIDLNMSIGCADSWAAALCRSQTVFLPSSVSHTSFCQLEPELTSVFLCFFCFCSLPLPFLLVSLSVVSSWWPQCLASNSGSLCKAFCWLHPKCLVPQATSLPGMEPVLKSRNDRSEWLRMSMPVPGSQKLFKLDCEERCWTAPVFAVHWRHGVQNIQDTGQREVWCRFLSSSALLIDEPVTWISEHGAETPRTLHYILCSEFLRQKLFHLPGQGQHLNASHTAGAEPPPPLISVSHEIISYLRNGLIISMFTLLSSLDKSTLRSSFDNAVEKSIQCYFLYVLCVLCMCAVSTCRTHTPQCGVDRYTAYDAIRYAC